MKIVNIGVLFYNAILIYFLITVGVTANSYQSLGPTLLLVPVGFYFSFSLVLAVLEYLAIEHPLRLGQFKRVLGMYSLAISLLLLLANVAASRSLSQVGFSFLYLPLIISFVLEVLTGPVKKYHKKTKPSEQELFQVVPTARRSAKVEPMGVQPPRDEGLEIDGEYLEPEDFSIQDQTRRQFLKVLGGGGVSLIFMMFFMPQKASAAFFGSSPGPGVIGIKDSNGVKIDPAEKKPTDGYTISQIDDAASPSYYGFVNKTGSWYIAKEDSAGAYRYVTGTTGFSTNWTNRASLSYLYFDAAF